MLLIERDQRQEGLSILAGMIDIAVDEADGVVYFVGNACDELTQARHLFALE